LGTFLLSLSANESVLTDSDIESKIKKHTYRLSLDGETTCQLPLVDTTKGTFTAAHCTDELKQNGYTSFFGINDNGKKKTFKLIKSRYEDRGMDYAFLSDGDKEGIEVGDSDLVRQGDRVYIYSPKLGMTSGTAVVVPNKRINPDKIYLDIGYCGESGSGVYNEDAELIGIFVARTGTPAHPRGVMIPINSILKDL